QKGCRVRPIIREQTPDTFIPQRPLENDMNLNVRLANEAWEALFTTHTRLMRSFQEEDVWQEVSMSEYDVLYTLSKSDGPLRLGELREGALLSQPALSRLVDRLVDRGLITREADEHDRRAVGL